MTSIRTEEESDPPRTGYIKRAQQAQDDRRTPTQGLRGLLVDTEDFHRRLHRICPIALVSKDTVPVLMLYTGPKDVTSIDYYDDDWKMLAAENARLCKPEMPNYGNSYAYSAGAAVVCGVDGGFPGASEALEQIERLLPNHRQVMAREPFWAIRPTSR